MALITADFCSETLKLQTAVDVLIPDTISSDNPPATLYLLHGLSGNYSSWVMKSSLLRYVENRPLTVIMPSADRSFYTDMAAGNRYWTYLTEELPEKLGNWLPLNDKREKCFVAGQSMGGYGALKWGLHHPEKFSGIIAMSCVIDLQAMVEREPEYQHDFDLIFGSRGNSCCPGNDLYQLVNRFSARKDLLPDILQLCGTEDPLYPDNLKFKERLDHSALPHVFQESAGNGHNWDYWDQAIQTALAWIDKKLVQFE